MLCSYPATTKSQIGKKMPPIFPQVEFVPVEIQTARQTNQFQRIPLSTHCKKVRFTFPFAILSVIAPKSPSAAFIAPE